MWIGEGEVNNLNLVLGLGKDVFLMICFSNMCSMTQVGLLDIQNRN